MCDYKGKSAQMRLQNHVKWLERMLDDAWQEIDRLSNFHKKLKEVSDECSEITTKYLELKKSYEELEEEHFVMLSLMYDERDEVLN